MDIPLAETKAKTNDFVHMKLSQNEVAEYVNQLELFCDYLGLEGLERGEGLEAEKYS